MHNDRAEAKTTTWFDFLSDHGLFEETFGTYYCDSGGLPYDLKEATKLMGELFHDFVTIGALRLPRGCSPSDYVLETFWIDGLESFNITRDGKRQQFFIEHQGWLRPRYRLHEYHVGELADKMARAINEIEDAH